MSLSRLRLRLTAGFALAFALGLGALSAGALGYLWYEASNRLRARLDIVAQGAVEALRRELAETPDSSLAYAANEVVTEWPINDDSFGIVDERGVLVAAADRAHAVDSALRAARRSTGATQFTFANGDEDYRASAISTLVYTDHGRVWKFGVVAYRSTEGMEGDIALLGGVLALAAPLIVLLSLGGGYMLARRALQPMSQLRAAIATIAPTDLTRRVPVTEPPDEIGALATDFNALLARLHEAQQRNHRFVREAAHQIRTPLTLVLGEASHELAASAPDADRAQATLTRIRVAAEQMRHRVDDLFLLAEAQAGEPMRLDDDVELDGLVLECTDLMRARASELGRSLAIGRAEPIIVRGNTMLLREAMLELIENGLRHGTPEMPITVSVHGEGQLALLAVESAGQPFELPANGTTQAPKGLGLPIVRWIAHGHAAELQVSRRGDRNTLCMSIPMATPPPA
jgi:signal transduction histidine kinase